MGTSTDVPLCEQRMYYVMVDPLHCSHTNTPLPEWVPYYVTAAALFKSKCITANIFAIIKQFFSYLTWKQLTYQRCAWAYMPMHIYAHAHLWATKNPHAKNQVASASSCGDMARTKVCNVLTDTRVQDGNTSPAYGWEVKTSPSSSSGDNGSGHIKNCKFPATGQ